MRKTQLEQQQTRVIQQTSIEVKEAIARYARESGIQIVVNFDPSPLDPEDRQGVLTCVNKTIVYHADLDISDDIVGLVAGGNGSARASAEKVGDTKLPLIKKIATIDMARAFKENDEFQAQLGQLKADVDAIEKVVQARKSELEELNIELSTLKEGTEAHRNLAKQWARATADLQVDIALKKKEILRREVRCYASSYEKIQERAARIARTQEIGLVIRFDGSPIRFDDRDSVLGGLNRTVIFQDEIDITDEVIRLVNVEPAVEL